MTSEEFEEKKDDEGAAGMVKTSGFVAGAMAVVAALMV